MASSITIVFIVLLLSYQFDTIKSQEKEMEEERNLLEEKLNNTELYYKMIEEENKALTDMLFNQTKMRNMDKYAIGKMDITILSGFTSNNLRQAFEKVAPTLVGTEDSFILVEKKYGINCLIPAAIAVLESNGGQSAIAKNKNNLCGLGAHDCSPYGSAMAFNSCDDSIMYLGELLATKYAPGGCYYGGEHNLRAINREYAKDDMWAAKVAKIVTKLVKEGTKT